MGAVAVAVAVGVVERRSFVLLLSIIGDSLRKYMFGGGFTSWWNAIQAYRDYSDRLDGDESNGEWHGSDRYWAENWPLFGKFHKIRQGAKRAQDYYDSTGTDDRYGDRYSQGAIGSMLSDLSAPLPGLKLPTMAKSLAKMYGAEVELNIGKMRKKRW